ncbi:signal peptidase II [Microbacterium sp. cx-55]|uniref:signal peptidase II n=1 Tax=unclassified Microbacterium TaxID=2609290 RepID=UPI001CBC93FB|nr:MULTISPECIES: signal peptidase II [unclassified Microbacterium]MBZ4486633.1 signal peptidase II [Microbacterium sp. cx-55]MCC4907601.1 signal peptidase II [Microbacterium sp. cx-59]UGB36401.1 signal peptidase II [Microbacterium sp. cx-55]
MTARPPLRTAAAGVIIASLAVLVLAADQFAKFLAIAFLPSEQAVPVIGDALVFYLIRNPGAAFSFGESVTWVFTIALAAVAIAIVIMARRIHSRAWAVILGLLLGGVLGNLTDRLLRAPGFAVGHVVDFISTPWMMPAIYNVADMFIVTMMIGVAILVLIGLRFDGTRDRASTSTDADASDAPPEGDSDAATDPAVVDARDPLFPVADPDAGAPPRADEPRRT